MSIKDDKSTCVFNEFVAAARDLSPLVRYRILHNNVFDNVVSESSTRILKKQKLNNRRVPFDFK